MADIVSVDFGKAARVSAKKLMRLMGLVEAQNAELLENPVRLFDKAQDAIAKRDRVIREAQDALRPRIEIAPRDYLEVRPIETVHVELQEYKRLKAAADIINRGIGPA